MLLITCILLWIGLWLGTAIGFTIRFALVTCIPIQHDLSILYLPILQVDTNLGNELLQQTFLCCGLGLLAFFLIMICSAIYIYREVERTGRNGIYWFLLALFIGPAAIPIWSLLFKQAWSREAWLKESMSNRANFTRYPYSPYPYYPQYTRFEHNEQKQIENTQLGQTENAYPQYPYYTKSSEDTQKISNENSENNNENKIDKKLTGKAGNVDRLTTGNIIALFISAIVTAIYLSTAAIVIALSFVPNLSEQNAIFDSLLTPHMILLQVAIQDIALVLSVYYHIIKKGAITFEDMGLSWTKLKPYQNIPIGILFGILLFGVSAIIEFAISNFVDTSSFEYGNAYAFDPENFSQYIVLLIAGTIFAPVSEEIFFRGFAFKAWLSKSGPYVAYIFSSFFFSIVHFNIIGILPIFIAGLVLAYIYHKTGSLFPAMIAHAVNNFIAITVLFVA
ncbi:MAG: CPBP family intramembrane glutamic endopeptidase [Thermoplasmata archaeon]